MAKKNEDNGHYIRYSTVINGKETFSYLFIPDRKDKNGNYVAQKGSFQHTAGSNRKMRRAQLK